MIRHIVTPVVQGLWIGSDLSDLEVMCIRSFMYHGHEFHLYTYDNLNNIPRGTIIKDANEILPQSTIYRSRNGGLSSFADFFRWTLLHKVGGLWVDMDVICLRPFDYPDDVVFGLESKGRVNIAVLQFPPGHFLPKVMATACDDVNLFQPIDTTKSAVKKILRRMVFGKAQSRVYANHTEPGGPPYFTKFLEFYGLADLAKPEYWFYPFPVWKWKDIFYPNPDAIAAIEGSYAVHVWHNAMHRTPGMDKNSLNYDGTLIGLLRDRYLSQCSNTESG
jgi:hypothetical protein